MREKVERKKVSKGEKKSKERARKRKKRGEV